MYEHPELREKVSGELYPGEKLLWVGKPRPGRAVVMQYGDEVLSGLFGAAITVLLLLTFPFFLMGGGVNELFVRVLVLIVMITVLFSLALPVYQYVAAQGTVYALTDRRILTIRPTLSGTAVQSQSGFERLERRERGGGSGDLIFGVETSARRMRHRRRLRKVGFFGIDNVRQVERLLLETFAGAERRTQA